MDVQKSSIRGKYFNCKNLWPLQLIYNLQYYGIRQKELNLVKRLIFKFVRSKDRNDLYVCKSLKRSVLKAEYEEGGLKVPDIECLDQCFPTSAPGTKSASKTFIRCSQKYLSVLNFLQIVPKN